MTTKELYKIEIMKELGLLPEDSLKNVKLYIEFILNKSSKKPLKSVNLKGIWNGSGFEKVGNLDKEIEKMRKDISESILNKGNL
ncbi:MAG: hypothetical protein WC212_09035 [Candidatus Delongbacteria bacterium]|jgi:hypothetical protein